MIAKKIPYKNGYFYKKGDSVTIQASDGVWAGYIYHTGTGIYISFILDRPIMANNATISLSLSGNSLEITTISGLRILSNLSVSDIKVAKNVVSCVISGTFDGAVTNYSPIAAGVSAIITFT